MSVVVSSLYNLRRKRENVLLSLKVVATNSMLTGVPSLGAVKNSSVFTCLGCVIAQLWDSSVEVARKRWLRWSGSGKVTQVVQLWCYSSSWGNRVFDGNWTCALLGQRWSWFIQRRVPISSLWFVHFYAGADSKASLFGGPIAPSWLVKIKLL